MILWPHILGLVVIALMEIMAWRISNEMNKNERFKIGAKIVSLDHLQVSSKCHSDIQVSSKNDRRAEK